MQPYQTFYPQMNNNYQMPMQNPYMDRMAQLQQYQQSLQQPVAGTQMSLANQMSALGKMVDSIDVVKATDIPMDGNSYYFPKADGTEVYCKQWLQNGTTRILTFKPVSEDNPNKVSSDTEKLKIEDFNTILEGISGKVDNVLIEISKIIEQPKQSSRTKKETNTE